MKKIFFMVLGVILVVFGVGYSSKFFRFFQDASESNIAWDDYCAFCNQEVLESQKIYENEWVMALLSYKPVNEGHILVIPKRHVERYEMLLEEEILQINRVIKKVHEISQKQGNGSGYVLLQKNGREVGQTVPHVHVHFVPQKIDSTPIAMHYKFLINLLSNPMSRQEVREMAAAYSEQFPEEKTSIVDSY